MFDCVCENNPQIVVNSPAVINSQSNDFHLARRAGLTVQLPLEGAGLTVETPDIEECADKLIPVKDRQVTCDIATRCAIRRLPNPYPGSWVVVQNSVIIDAGLGVFVIKSFKKGDIIGEYFGTVYPPKTSTKHCRQDRLYATDDNFTIEPHMECLMQYINDAIDICVLEWVVSWELTELCTLPYTKETIRNVITGTLRNRNEYQQDSEYYLEYNVDWKELDGRVFIVATRDIDCEEELFIDYGGEYWAHHLNEYVNKKMFDDGVEDHHGMDDIEMLDSDDF
jgi:hypothetical protein